MSRLRLGQADPTHLRVLCLGAHCDDIEIGCGGTILRLIEEQERVTCDWVAFSGAGGRAGEGKRSAERFLQGAAKANISIRGLTDTYFPAEWAEAKRIFSEIKQWGSPDVVFTHFRNDLHQDHRVISELTWNAFRDHLILEYEIPKYDGDLGAPNFFVGLERSTCERKIDTLVECYESQGKKKWFSPETFWALLRLRGVEAYSGVDYAEAFYCRKAVL